MGEDATTVDVADHHGGNAATLRQAQVHDVMVEQVDLGRASCAFADHDVEAGAQVGQGTVHDPDQIRLGPLVVRRLPGLEGTAHDDDLRRPLPCGLEEYGVHRRLGLGARRHGLQPLCAADLRPLSA